MDRPGIVTDLRDGLAVVEADEGGVWEAKNDVGAGPGDRVTVRAPELFSAREYHLVYGLPLFGTVAGAVAGWALAGSRVAGTLRRLGGPLFGELLSSADNLAMFIGLIGLGLCYLGSAEWVRRRKNAAPRAVIVEVIARPLHPKPNQR